jgi:type I restriction enzyme S subunit
MTAVIDAGYKVPDGWIVRTVDEIKAAVPSSCVAGPFGSKISSKYFVEEGIPVIRGSNLRDDLTRFVPEGFVFVSEDRAREYGPQHVRGGDLVFTCWGTIGQVGIVPPDGPYDCYIISNKQLKLRVNTEIVNPLFCFYYFSSPKYVEYIRARGIGGAVPGINLGILKSLKIALPRRPIQDQIVSILSAYDELIDNNFRRIVMLEEAARMLYREWFVCFRFPGHEHVKTFDGIPEGWARRTISDLAEVLRGKSYSSEELVDDDSGQPFVNLKCIERFGGFRSSGLKCFRGEHKQHHLITPGDIVVAVTDMTRDAMIVAQAARIPKIVGNNAIFSMDLVRIAPKQGVEREWLYSILRYSSFSPEVRETATGATVLHLKPKYIESWRALVPPRNLRDLFIDVVCDLFDQQDNLETQSQRLAQARDLLLPRLMNGEIAV